MLLNTTVLFQNVRGSMSSSFKAKCHSRVPGDLHWASSRWSAGASEPGSLGRASGAAAVPAPEPAGILSMVRTAQAGRSLRGCTGAAGRFGFGH